MTVATVVAGALQDLPSWMLLALGFYIALRVLRFPDLTVDATFLAGTAGAALGAEKCGSAGLGLVFAVLLGGLGGLMTGGLYSLQRSGAFKLLASVLVLFSFYSINYRVLDRRATVGFGQAPTMWNNLADWETTQGFGVWRPWSLVIAYVVAAACFASVYLLLRTRWGLLVRSAGTRGEILRLAGVRPVAYVVMGLMLSNGLVAMGGWLFASRNGNAMITQAGMVLHALAAVVFGECIVNAVPRLKHRYVSLSTMLLAPVLGALVYQLVRSLAAVVLTQTTAGPESKMLMYPSTQDQNLLFAVILFLLIGVLKWSRVMKMSLFASDQEGI